MCDFILDFETFTNGVIVFDNGKEILKETIDKLNKDLSEWELVKVLVSKVMVDELTEVTKYEYRYRLYLSKVYKLLGFDEFVANRYKDYYWEKNSKGKYTGYYLP